MSTCTAVHRQLPDAALDLYCGLLVCVSLRSSKVNRSPTPDIKKPDQEIGLGDVLAVGLALDSSLTANFPINPRTHQQDLFYYE